MSEERTTQTEPRGSRSGFCMGCVIGGALLVAAVIALAIGVRRAPEKFPGPVRAIFGARQTAETGEGGGLSPELVEAARGVKPTVEVTIKQDDLNSYLEEHPDAVGLPKGFAAPRVEFREDLVVASVRTKVLVPVRVWMVMRPEVKDGRISLSVVKVKAGGVSLPGEFRQQIQREVERLLAERIEQSGFKPQSVEVGEGTFTVKGRVLPAPL